VRYVQQIILQQFAFRLNVVDCHSQEFIDIGKWLIMLQACQVYDITTQYSKTSLKRTLIIKLIQEITEKITPIGTSLMLFSQSDLFYQLFPRLI